MATVRAPPSAHTTHSRLFRMVYGTRQLAYIGTIPVNKDLNRSNLHHLIYISFPCVQTILRTLRCQQAKNAESHQTIQALTLRLEAVESCKYSFRITVRRKGDIHRCSALFKMPASNSQTQLPPNSVNARPDKDVDFHQIQTQPGMYVKLQAYSKSSYSSVPMY